MDPLISLENHKELKRICEKYERELDQILNEVEIGAILGSPIKYTKIKNNSKKYQKALVQQALNDVDYEKKKEKGNYDDLDSKQKATLTAANKAKNKALADKASAISQRMSDLASTDGLKRVEKLAKSKAKIASAETTLKAAGAEETKKLKLQIQDWNKDANDASTWLKDYKKDNKGDDEPQEGGDKTEALEKRKEKINRTLEKQDRELNKLKDQKAEATGDKRDELEQKIEQVEGNMTDNKDSIKNIDAEIKKAKGEKVEKPETTKTPSTDKNKKGGKEEEGGEEEGGEEDSKAAKKKVDKIKKKIEDVTNLIDKQKEKDPDKDLSKYTDLLGKRQGELEDAEGELKKAGEKKEESNTEAFYLKMNETLDNIGRGVDDIKKQIHFPTYEINESVASKFTRLINEKRSV